MTKRSKAPEVANPERGEHEIMLAGTTYLLRPSYTAVRAIEDKTGKSIIDLARAGHSGAMQIGDAAIIASEMMRAGAKDGDDMLGSISTSRVGEMIFEEGLPSIVSRLTIALTDAATGGRLASGEAKAVA